MSFLFRKRRSMGAEQGRLQGVPTPAGIQSMDESLQKKFSKGIQFNIKILIRGDRNTGKTCLFHRMQGKQFTEAYIPTNEIQVTSILWSYKVTNDTVKVEVWDIVDKGRSQKKGGKSLLKMFNEPSSDQDPANMPLDAEFLDVYKGAHGVVFTYDMTKQWTWKYIEKEVPKVPLHIPIIIVGNFRDMEEHRVVSRDEAMMLIQGLDRPDGAAPVRYAEGSMKNGFGLTHLHKFLSVPFLQLQQETLLQQLQGNREQTLAAKEELDSASKSDDQNYDMFLEKIQKIVDDRKKKSEPPLTPDSTPSRGNDSPRLRSSISEKVEEEPTTPVGVAAEQQRSGSLSSKLFSGFRSRTKEAAKNQEVPSESPRPVKARPTMMIDDFVPEGGEVESFLEDSEESNDEEDSEEDSDDDVDGGNPQVAIDDDLSSPEEEAPPIKSAPLVPEVMKQQKPLVSAKEIVLTESEEESEEESDEPRVVEDEDVNLDQLTKPPTQYKKVFNNNVPLDELFNVPQKKEKKKKKMKPAEDPIEIQPVEPTVKPAKKKSGGLMLEFSPTPSQAPPPAAESPAIGERRDSKKKKKSKKRRESKETEAVLSVGGGKGSTGDPFTAISSLDAWLNSDSTGKDGPLESSWSTHTAKAVEVGEESGSGEDEHREREKPHKPRRTREGVEKERSSHKKKHKHKSSNRHRTEKDDDRNYEAL
ncbi:rab-like protein 6 [Halichondria panicea]|uniref:rab-like protein 6 n=1 Tax=Halichondria panicea TaxID=6063 RepID=UPI00312B8E24